MKWLQNNPIGTALLAVIGVFLLISLSLAVVRALPITTEITEEVAQAAADADAVVVAAKAGDLSDYQVINDKPVFNVSRLPVIADDEDALGAEDESIAIKDAPEVKLTGVIITPSVRIATLKPVQGGQESVMAKEGVALTGEFVGWQVSSVMPRNVVLESQDGQKLELELQVHDVKIAEPPKPAPPKTAQSETAEDNEVLDDEGQPLTRAEQIRQRIAERREELRREQEEQQAQQDQQTDGGRQASPPPSYQSAIRALMNKKPKDDSSDDDENG